MGGSVFDKWISRIMALVLVFQFDCETASSNEWPCTYLSTFNQTYNPDYKDTPIRVAQTNQLFPLTFHIFLIRKFGPLLLDQATDREFVVDKSSLAMHTFICALLIWKAMQQV